MIPKRLLIHSCEAERKGKTDRDGNVSESALYSLSACRIDVVKGLGVNEAGQIKSDALTLFYDVVNSKSEPAGYAPQLDDLIHFQGHDYKIKTVRELCTQSKPQAHHFEAGLV